MFVYQSSSFGSQNGMNPAFVKAIGIIEVEYSKRGKSISDFYVKNYEFLSNLMNYLEESRAAQFVPNYARQYLSDNASKAIQDKTAFFFSELNGDKASKLRANMHNGIELIAKAETYLKEKFGYDVAAEKKKGAKFEEIMEKSVALLKSKGIELDMKALANAESPAEFLAIMKKFEVQASAKLRGVEVNKEDVENRLAFRLASMSLNFGVMTCNMVEQPQNISFDSATGQMVIQFTDADDITSSQLMYDSMRVYSMMRKFDKLKQDYGSLDDAGLQKSPSLESRSRYLAIFSGSNRAYDAVAGEGASKEVAKFAAVLEEHYQDYMLKNQAVFAANLASLPASVQVLFGEQRIAFWRTDNELNFEKEKAKKIGKKA